MRKMGTRPVRQAAVDPGCDHLGRPVDAFQLTDQGLRQSFVLFVCAGSCHGFLIHITHQRRKRFIQSKKSLSKGEALRLAIPPCSRDFTVPSGMPRRLRDLAQRQPVNETQRERLPLAGRQLRKEPADVPVFPGRCGRGMPSGVTSSATGNRPALRTAVSAVFFAMGYSSVVSLAVSVIPFDPVGGIRRSSCTKVSWSTSRRGIDVGREAQRDTQHVILVAQVQGLRTRPQRRAHHPGYMFPPAFRRCVGPADGSRP